METRTKAVAIFDVCDTLFSANTTVGFLQFFARQRSDPNLGRTLERWTSRSSPAFLAGAAAYRFLHRDIARTRLIRTLRGYTRKELEVAGADYARLDLPKRFVEPVQQLLRKHIEHGHRVILASSSLDIVIAPIAQDLGVEWVASELGYDCGMCTGQLVRDLTGKKEVAIAPLLPSNAELHVYTDNRSDKALLQMAEHCTIILPAGSNRTRWAGEDCDYLAI
jgi:phosphoserine phosphatase